MHPRIGMEAIIMTDELIVGMAWKPVIMRDCLHPRNGMEAFDNEGLFSSSEWRGSLL